jgi:hypothetical protein
MVLRDIMCSGYVAGGNTRFFGEKAAAGGPYDAGAITRAMVDRLSFTDDASGDYESMLAFAVPLDLGSKRDQVYSISSRLLPWEVTAGQKHDYFPGGNDYGHYDYYKTAYGLDQIHFGEDIRAAENMEFISNGSVNNSLCFVGPHRVYSPWSSTFFELMPGQGHFGPDAIPGDVRCSAIPRPTISTSGPTRLTHPLSIASRFHRRAGAAARPSPSSRLATPWSRSRLR